MTLASPLQWPAHLPRTTYRRLAKQHHPDVGGDPETWRAIRYAYEQGMKARSA